MGQFRFKVLPFGLLNAVSLFQKLQDRILAGLNWFTCPVYLDDIVVFSRTFEEHLTRLCEVITRIQSAGLKFNQEKCSLFQRRVEFLGYEISEHGVEPSKKKVETILGWPRPRDLTELRAWLGLIGYYRRWVPQFGTKALFDLVKKCRKFEWTEVEQQSFEELKKCLVSPPILSLRQDEGRYILDTDCPDFAAGAVLQQEQEGHLRVIAYASRVLKGAELNYSTTRKETTAAVIGLKQFRQYLLGRQFTLRTDHAALTSFMKTSEVVGQQARHLDFLSQSTFEIVHRPGTSHKNSDSLSRRPERSEYTADVQSPISHDVANVTDSRNSPPSVYTIVPTDGDEPSADFVQPENETDQSRRIESRNFISEEEGRLLHIVNIGLEQLKDDDLRPIIEWKEDSEEQRSRSHLEKASERTRALWAQWESLELKGRILYHRFEDARRNLSHLQIILPQSLVKQFAYQCHIGQTGGHFGVRKTQDQFVRRAYAVGWKNVVE